MSKSPAVLTPFRICACALLASAALRAEPAVIGLARAYLGPDSTLDGITSIHFAGTLDRLDPDHPDKGPIHAKLDMIFVKPSRQRQLVGMEKVSETTVLDGYDAWDRLQDNADATRYRLRWLARQRDQGPSRPTHGRTSTFSGDSGAKAPSRTWARKPSTASSASGSTSTTRPGIVFERYFDRDSGRLVLTVRGSETIRESGEIMVDGVRFPKKVVSTVEDGVRARTWSRPSPSTSVVAERAAGPDLFQPFRAPRLPAPGGPAASPLWASSPCARSHSRRSNSTPTLAVFCRGAAVGPRGFRLGGRDPFRHPRPRRRRGRALRAPV
jgi:hypothetical protein